MIRRRFINLSFKPYNIEDYLTITALEDDFSLKVPSECFYSINGGKWMRIDGGETLSIMEGDFYCFKKESTSSIGTFTIEKACKLGGNAMSMIYGDKAKGETSVYAGLFYRLFSGCTGIKEISNNFLPATTLASSCYSYMFQGCTGLTQAPSLPATTLASSCYDSMFQGCTGLTQAPSLPATTLASFCYSSMFYGCTGLTQAPSLPATTLDRSCYSSMFQGCTNLNYIKALFTTTPSSSYTSNWVNGVASSGTFVKSKDATWNVTGVNGIPSGWTVQKV